MQTVYEAEQRLHGWGLVFHWGITEVPQIKKAIICNVLRNDSFVVGYAVCGRGGWIAFSAEEPPNNPPPKPVIDLNEAFLYLTGRWLNEFEDEQLRLQQLLLSLKVG